MKKKFLYIFLPAVILVTACNKDLSQQPQASLDASTAFTTKQGVEAGIIGAYDAFQGTGYYSLNFLLFSEMYADNIQEVGTFTTFQQVYNKTITADNVDIATMWNAMYNVVNRANNVIYSAPGISDPSFQKDRAVGECETIRAMAYFDLLRMFGGSANGFNIAGGVGVPLRITPTLTAAQGYNVPRASEAAVYTQILADLTDAINKLPNTVGVGRVNKYVATALLARVQLYRAQYVDAELQATNVINSPNNYSLVSGANYGTIYSAKNTSESIWEIQYNSTDANNIAFYYYPTTSGGRNEVSSTASLRDAFEVGDVRKPICYSTTPNAKQLKYTNVSVGIDNVMLFRLAEMYLIRAEARAQQNNLAGAISDLNVIRLRAGLTPTTAVTQADILTAILAQDRLEFAHEAHRFFDLRRFNQTGLVQSARNLFPIPQSEILNSGNVVVQQPGGVY